MTLPKDEPFPSFLNGRNPGALLNRIAEGDVLDLEQKTYDRVMDLALMIDPERIAARSLARVAYDAAAHIGRHQPFSVWLSRRIDVSLKELIEEDLYSEFSDAPPTDGPYPDYYQRMGKLLETEPAFARRLCVVFNALSLESRQPFFEVVIREVPIEEYAMKMDVSLDDLETILIHTITVMINIAQGDGKELF